jgi:putative Mg2+ transporter-C (MgtC) family protein
MIIEQVTAPDTWFGVLARLGGATLVGLVIGVNREVAQKPAGVKTHALVALGSALFALTPLLMVAGDGQVDHPALTRVVQGIVAGVGFIGGGAILRRRHQDEIEGITTATTIWLSAALGIASAVGLWQVALVGLGLGLLVLVTGGAFDGLLRRFRPPEG